MVKSKVAKVSTILIMLCYCLVFAASNEFLRFESDLDISAFKNYDYTSSNASKKITANVRYNHQKGAYTIDYKDLDENAAAYGTFTMSMEETGWDTLAISSYKGEFDKYTDDTKSFAMGYLEGYVTSNRIWKHYTNLRHYFYFEDGFNITEAVKDFLNKNLNWMKTTAIKNKTTDPYWAHVYSVVRQVEGMVAGYNAAIAHDLSKKLSYAEFQIMNAQGDLDELAFWDKSKIPDFKNMSSEKISNYIEAHSHCSSLIKVSADFSDLWFGHNTWTTFSSMTRIFKEYRFVSNMKTEKSRTVAFSGYPGTVSSVDDFYITDRDLFITETTNEIFKKELYENLTYESLLTWIRTVVANRLSDNGKTWTEIFPKYNSGTYNNQFQILDLKLIDIENQVISENALWILEQMPGYYEAADVTAILRYGYWPSYNSAFFPNIRTMSGYDDLLNEKPEMRDTIDYDGCARANIFRRDQSKVNSLEAYKKLLRYNKFQTDPLSKGKPNLSIACRGDFSSNPECSGATDAKVASIHDVKGKTDKKISMISGPTADNQEPFDATKATCAEKPKYVFEGLQKKFNYGWTEYVTTLFEKID